MTHLNKLKVSSFLRWVSSDMYRSYIKPLKSSDLAVFQRLEFCSSSLVEKDSKFIVKATKGARRKAQEALEEYLHSTRGLEYLDAEFISYNSPLFLDSLLEKVKSDAEIKECVMRLLRYHPINEYEPFFESMGLKPSEYASFLPRDLMFLRDDAKVLGNYHVLCNYGIARGEIGRIYTEANEVFKHDYGVLISKLTCFEELGLDRTSMIKIVSLNPRVLIGKTNIEFLKVLEKLKRFNIDCANMEEHLRNWDSNSWSHNFKLLCFLSDTFGSDEELQKILSFNLRILFELSRNLPFSLVGFLLKFGFTEKEMCTMFSQIPQVELKTFTSNLRKCYKFLIELDMESQEIGKIVRSHPLLLGSCSLKKLSSLAQSLKIGKKRLSKIVKENPQILKDWVMRLKVEPLPKLESLEKSREMKAKFLLDLGFIENSKEYARTLKLLRGKGTELQERFDCFVKAGIDKKVAAEMIKLAPNVLTQSKENIEMKIDFLLNKVRYPLSALVRYPEYVCFSMERVNLRFSMYNWLKKQGKERTDLTLSTILTYPEKVFIKHFVDGHPGGPEVYQKLKKEINPHCKLFLLISS